MRLEDWQKWLDTQFIDPAKVQEEPAADSEWPAAVESQPEEQIESEPEAASDEVEVFASDPEPVVTVESQVEQKASSAGFVEDVSVPSIEQYLPFLRGTSVPDEPEVQASAPTVESENPAVEVQAEAPETNIESVELAAQEETEEVLIAEPVEVVAAEAAPEEPVVAPPVKGAVTATKVEPTPIAVAPVEEEMPAHIRAVQPGRRIIESHKRTRNAKRVDANQVSAKLADGELWSLTPRHIQALMAASPGDPAQGSDDAATREARIDLISKLLDPNLALEDTARLLDVHPLTVRKYAATGYLTHQRASGDQRRFKLSDVMGFLENQSRIGSGSKPG